MPSLRIAFQSGRRDRASFAVSPSLISMRLTGLPEMSRTWVSQRVTESAQTGSSWSMESGSDHDHVDVAPRVVVTASEGAEQRDVRRRRIEVLSAFAELLEERVMQVAQHQDGPRSQVLDIEAHHHRGRHVAALHDAQGHEAGDDPGDVCERHP